MYIKITEIFFHSLFSKSLKYGVFLSLRPSRFELATIPVLHSHTWLTAIVLDSSGLEPKTEVRTINKDLGVISVQV